MSTRRTDQVNLGSLATEKLPAKLVEAIDEVAVELETIETEVYIGVRQGKLVAKAQLQIPLKKTLIIVGIIVFLWFAFPELHAYIPLLLGLLQKR